MRDMQRGGDLMDPRRDLPDREVLIKNRDEKILRDCLNATGGSLQDVCDQAHIQVWQAEIEKMEADEKISH